MATKNILVIDADTDYTDRLRQHLGLEDCEVSVAETGWQGIRSAQSGPDLIVLNLVMPDLSGQRLFTILRSRQQYVYVPIVIITDTANESRRSYYQGLGADGIFDKSTELRELLLTIGQLLSSSVASTDEGLQTRRRAQILFCSPRPSLLRVARQAIAAHNRQCGEPQELETARSGLGLVEKVRRRAPDLVVMDDDIARINGYEVCRRLKSPPVDGRVPKLLVFGTPARDSEVIERFSRADECIPEDLNIKLLNAKIQKHLRRPNPERASALAG